MNRFRAVSALLGLILSCVATPSLGAQTSILTNHNDNARTGSNTGETILTTSNVNVNQFGKLFSQPVDASIYAQPLYVPNVNISTKGVHNVVFVATMNDSVYAFDADRNTGSNAAPLWSVNFTNPAAGITAVPSSDVQPYATDILGTIGIESTPVIDSTTQTMFLVARTKENGAYVQRLHALDIPSGAEKFGGPVTIVASINSGSGTVNFDPKVQNQRPSLALANGSVYITWASHNDAGMFYGWVMAYSASTLQQTAVFNDTPTGGQGGIWQSGQGPAIDGAGNVYVSTGNGAWDGSRNFGSTVLKLTPSLGISDWFTPGNYASLNAGDLDLGSSGPLLIPNTTLLFAGGKQGIAYLVDTTSMGHLASGNGQIAQSFLAANGNMHGSAVYWQSPVLGPLIYIWSEFDYLKAFHFNGSTLDTAPISQSSMRVPDGMPGGMTAVSSNGSAAGTGILWTTAPWMADANHATVQGIVRAFDASDLTSELWDSQQNPGRDDVGNFAKFVPPTITNGKVYMATFSNALVVYGLLPQVSDFQLSTLAPSQSVAPSNSISYTVTVSDPPGSLFAGTVTFSLSGLPANSTAQFSPSSINGDGSTTLTVTAAANVSPGTYPLTVTGTSGSSNHSLSLTLNVNTRAMGVGPGLSVDVGSPATPGSSTYSGGTYTVKGAGTDIWNTSDQFQFNYWQMVGDGTVIARIVAPANTSFYAKSGVMIRESLYANSSYVMMAGLQSLSGFQYRNGTAAAASSSPYFTPSYPMWVKVVRANGNFTGYSSPDGVTWTQRGDSVSINMASTVYVGLAVTSQTPGTLGTATFDNVSYQPSANSNPDFTISANPAAQSVLAGNVNTYAVSTTAANGFTGSVGFSVSGLPSGATASFSPSTVTGTGTTTLSIATTAGLNATQYPLTIRATSGTLVRDQTVNLAVTNFSLSANPASQSVTVGGSTSFNIVDTDQNSYTGAANLSISGVPAGVTAAFSPAAVDRLVSSTLSIQAGSAMTPGTYNMTVSGTSNGQVRTVPVTLTVNGVPDFSMAVSPGSQAVLVGSAASYSVSTTALSGFAGIVAFSAAGLPTGATATFTPASVTGSGTSTIAIQTSSSTPSGNYSIQVTGVSGSLSHSVTFTFAVTDFSVTLIPGSRGVTPGASASFTVNVASLNSFTGSVALSASGLPAGVNATFTPASLTNSGSSTLSVQTSSGTPAGTYSLGITGTSGSLAHTALATLIVGSSVFGNGAGGDTDVGSPALAGSSNYSAGVYTVQGSGADIWGTSDQFNLNYWPMTGDGTATARVTSLTNPSFYAKAGIMMRENLNTGSAYAYAMTIPTQNAFQYRTGTGNYAATSGYVSTTFPIWVRLVRAGANLTSYTSADGVNWTQTGNTVTVKMANTVYIGMAVTSQNPGQLATAVFDNLSFTAGGSSSPDFTIVAASSTQTVSAGQNATYNLTISAVNGFTGTVALSASGLPAGTTAIFNPATVNSPGTSTVTLQTSTTTPAGTYWPTILAQGGGLTRATPVNLIVNAAQSTISGNGSDAEVGNATLKGSWTVSNGVHTVAGAGTDIWNTSDQFNYNYWQLSGDATITARVVSLTNTNFYAKAGVMIRETLNGGSAYAMSVVCPSLLNFHYRTSTGSAATSGPYFNPTFPQWARVVRSGNLFTSYSSVDGVTWSQVNSPVSIPMAQSVYVGLAVTSHAATQLNTAVFDNIVITQP